jgi:transcriptional regulator with XRE-family HTH domain
MKNNNSLKGYLKEYLDKSGLSYTKLASLAGIPIGAARSALEGSKPNYENAARIAKYALKIPFIGLFIKPEEYSSMSEKINFNEVDDISVLKQLQTEIVENKKLQKEIESYNKEMKYLVNKVRVIEEEFEAYKKLKSR